MSLKKRALCFDSRDLSAAKVIILVAAEIHFLKKYIGKFTIIKALLTDYSVRKYIIFLNH